MELIRGDSKVLVFSILDDNNKLIELDLIDTLTLTAREKPSERSRVLFIKNKSANSFSRFVRTAQGR